MYTRNFLKTHQTPKLSETEAASLEAAVARTAEFRPKQIIVRQQVPLSQCTLLLEGFVERYKDTPEGRRQILAIHVPGDFVDLHSCPPKRLEHSVAALTAVKVALFPHAAVRGLTEQSATLTELLWRSTLIDAAINREWIVSIGARSAAVRLAHLFCEIYTRLERIGLTDGLRFAFPLTQIDLADATGRPGPCQPHAAAIARAGAGRVPRGAWRRFSTGRGCGSFAEFDPGYLFLE